VQKSPAEDHEPFETVIEGFKHERYKRDIVDSELSAKDQQDLVKRFKALVSSVGPGFPTPGISPRRGGRRVR
jgi:pyruvate,orthophosphate dikinase